MWLSFVSTHAPTKGATWRVPRLRHAHQGFNPRAHEGRDKVIRG